MYTSYTPRAGYISGVVVGEHRVGARAQLHLDKHHVHILIHILHGIYYPKNRQANLRIYAQLDKQMSLREFGIFGRYYTMVYLAK